MSKKKNNSEEPWEEYCSVCGAETPMELLTPSKVGPICLKCRKPGARKINRHKEEDE